MYFTSIRLRSNRLWILASLILFFPAFGQVGQVNRLNIPLLVGESNYFEIATFKEKGLLLFRTISEGDGNFIELQKIDTAFKEQWKGFIKIDRAASFFQQKTLGGFLFLLFRNKNLANSNFQAIAINEEKGVYSSYDINNAIPFNPTDFDVTSNSIIIGGYLSLRPIVIHYSLANKTTKVLPGYFNEPGEITQLKTYPSGSFDILVRVKNNEKKKILKLNSYSSDGTQFAAKVLLPEKHKDFIQGKSIRTSNGKQLLAGTYGRNPENPRGIFSARIDSTGETTINYYAYAELDHFFDYMRLKKKNRIKKRIERKREKGQSAKFNFKLILHELKPIGPNFMLTAESYYPHYSYPRNTLRNSYSPSYIGNPYTNNYQNYRGDYVFDGYQYTHSIHVGFNKEGKLLWDNCFEINDVRNMKLEALVKVTPNQSTTGLYYLFENTVHSKVIKDSTVIESKKSFPIPITSDIEESPKNSGDANSLIFWYDNFLIASGVQVLRPRNGRRNAFERNIFYISKIRAK